MLLPPDGEGDVPIVEIWGLQEEVDFPDVENDATGSEDELWCNQSEANEDSVDWNETLLHLLMVVIAGT